MDLGGRPVCGIKVGVRYLDLAAEVLDLDPVGSAVGLGQSSARRTRADETQGGEHMTHTAMTRLSAIVQKLTAGEAGQGFVEYALILLLLSIIAVGTMTILGTSVNGLLTTVTGAF
jgi:Flp pilus assembly pilin Flp